MSGSQRSGIPITRLGRAMESFGSRPLSQSLFCGHTAAGSNAPHVASPSNVWISGFYWAYSREVRVHSVRISFSLREGYHSCCLSTPTWLPRTYSFLHESKHCQSLMRIAIEASVDPRVFVSLGVLRQARWIVVRCALPAWRSEALTRCWHCHHHPRSCQHGPCREGNRGLVLETAPLPPARDAAANEGLPWGAHQNK